MEPGDPDTRGCNIGARRAPVLMLKSSPGLGRARKDASESSVYAAMYGAHIEKNQRWRTSTKLLDLAIFTRQCAAHRITASTPLMAYLIPPICLYECTS